MNKLNAQQTGGFPMETDTITFMQDAYDLLQKCGHIAGDYSIISGCFEVGNNVSDGVIFVNNELLPFKGGAKNEMIIIVETPTPKEFENGQSKLVYFDRYATFGDGVGAMEWSGFKKPFNTTQLTEKMKALVPIGMISMWAGSINQIPIGWALCDGSNGTPNLSGKFIVGYQSGKSDYAMAQTGGMETVTLTESQMPQHNHSASTSSAGAHTHTYQKSKAGRGYATKADDYPHSIFENSNTGSAGAHTHLVTIENKGGGQAHENRPPYYTLAFIQFKGN